MEKTFSKIKTLKSRRKLSLPAAASPLMNNAGHHGEANHDTVMHFVHFLSGMYSLFIHSRFASLLHPLVFPIKAVYPCVPLHMCTAL